ncbi:MAG TPA: alpha-ketoacid dehydrogenase subunit beta [Longimicrobiaceae bacterium]|nr:alpha-ketoacid dehydrogenase subunit beta [Longimicrobiaceae bacterium]
MAERILTMSRAMAEAIGQEMERDDRIFYMGEDVAAYGGIFGSTTGLLQKFGPDRIIDTPISESAFVGAALGATGEGFRPIVELMFVDFFGVAMDQIYNHIAKNTYMSGAAVHVPLVITAATGAGYNDAAQHSQSLYALFAHVPGLKVVVPSNAYDAKGLMTTAIRDPNPVMYFFHKALMGLGWMTSPRTASTPVPEEPYEIPLGEARVVREGDAVTVVTLGMPVHHAMQAAAELEQDGISIEILDLRTLVPLDREAVVDSARKTGRVLVVDEDYRSYGVTGEIAATLLEADPALVKQYRRIAVPDVPIPYSRPLEQFVLPSADKIVSAVREMTQAEVHA